MVLNNEKKSRKQKIDMVMNEKLVEVIKRKSINGELTCGQASRISASSKIDMKTIGAHLDMMGIRITRCQLGFFGLSEDDKPLRPAAIIKTDMEEAIRQAVVDGRLSCKAACDLAAMFGVPKRRISSLCEALNIKIKPCQLGAF